MMHFRYKRGKEKDAEAEVCTTQRTEDVLRNGERAAQCPQCHFIRL